MPIYEIIYGRSVIERDKKTAITKEVNRLKRRELVEGKDFYVKGRDTDTKTAHIQE